MVDADAPKAPNGTADGTETAPMETEAASKPEVRCRMTGRAPVTLKMQQAKLLFIATSTGDSFFLGCKDGSIIVFAQEHTVSNGSYLIEKASFNDFDCTCE